MSPPKQQAKAGVLSALAGLDAFPKVNEDFFHKTTSGGIITVVAYAFMLLLFLTETRERGGHGRVVWSAATERRGRPPAPCARHAREAGRARATHPSQLAPARRSVDTAWWLLGFS